MNDDLIDIIRGALTSSGSLDNVYLADHFNELPGLSSTYAMVIKQADHIAALEQLVATSEAELAAAKDALQRDNEVKAGWVIDRRESLKWIIENTSQVRVRDLALDIYRQMEAALTPAPAADPVMEAARVLEKKLQIATNTLTRIAEFNGDDADLDEWGAADLCRAALRAITEASHAG